LATLAHATGTVAGRAVSELDSPSTKRARAVLRRVLGSGISERAETAAAADKHVLDASGGTAAADKHVPDASGGTAAADKHVPDASGGSMNADLWPAKPEAQALATQLGGLPLLALGEHRARHRAAGEEPAAAVP
jgi:hypothetical protein